MAEAPPEKRPSTDAAATTEPQSGSARTCVVCRTERDVESLLRLSRLPGGELALGAKGSRGAWVCLTPVCLAGLDARVVSRALKGNVTVPSPDELRADLITLAQERIFQTLGLARRSQALDIGAEAALDQRDTDGAVLLLADDGAPRHRAEHPEALVFSTMDDLGRAIGQRPVAVLRVRPGHFAKTVQFWLSALTAAGWGFPVSGPQPAVPESDKTEPTLGEVV